MKLEPGNKLLLQHFGNQMHNYNLVISSEIVYFQSILSDDSLLVLDERGHFRKVSFGACKFILEPKPPVGKDGRPLPLKGEFY